MATASVKEYEIMAQAQQDVASSPNRNLLLDVQPSQDSIVENNSVLSPKSPSSMFTKTTLENSKGCIVSTVLLSFWDNILGPRIRHQWLIEASQAFLHDTLAYVASHSLSGEICRNLSDSSIDTQFCVVKDRSAIVTSFIFGAMDKGEMAVHALSLLLPYASLKSYLNLHELCVSWIMQQLGELRVIMEKESHESALQHFSNTLTEFVLMLNSLREASIPCHIPLCDTAFHPQHHLPTSLLRRAITSHLLTAGRSVVVGLSAAKINVMLATLALFLSPSQRCRCRYAVDTNQYAYQPQLMLQGFVKGGDKDPLASLQLVFSTSSSPCSLIDLHTEDVRLSALLHQHAAQYQNNTHQCLAALWAGSNVDSWSNSDIFHTTDDPETLVSNLMDELMLLPATNGLRESYVAQFVSMIERRAVSLLKYVQSEMRLQKCSLRDATKKLKHDLALTVPGDFYIVLATANQLKPDIARFLCGETRTDTEFRHYLDKLK